MMLHFYLLRKSLLSFLIVLAVFAGLIGLLNMVDQVREFAGLNVTFGEMLQLTVLATPKTLYTLLPLIVVFSTLSMFLRLARTSELVVIRAAGRSALRALVAPCIMAIVIGVFAVSVINPIVAATAKQYETRSNALRGDAETFLSVTGEGVWLRQGNSEGQTVIRANSTNLDGTRLSGVSFVSLAPDGTPQQRIEARSATLEPGGWQLEDVKLWPLIPRQNPELNASFADALFLPSDLTPDRIRNSFGTPQAIPIWALPGFIDRLKSAGFSARRHAVWFHMEMALPVFLVAMVLIGAGFTMRHTRVARTGPLVLTAIMMAFALYFVRNFAQILGENAQMPILLAAWVPPLGAIGLALGLLLHTEDG